MARTRNYKLKNQFYIKLISKIKYKNINIIPIIFISILFAQSKEFYTVLYHSFPTSIPIEISIIAVKSVIFTFPVIASVIFFSISVVRFISSLSLIFAIYTLLSDYLPINWLQNVDVTVMITASILLSAASLYYLSERAWHQSARLILVVIVAWSLSPLLLAGIQSNQTTRRTITVERVVSSPPKAVVILILDEMSPELAPLLRPVLTTPDHILHVGQVQKAGKDTIYAIPSMLTRQRHDGAAPCGVTSLCGNVFFDMAKLRATQSDTDVVGFFHPYCAIGGLRSCWTPVSTHASLGAFSGQVAAKIQLVVGRVFGKYKEPVTKSNEESIRDAIAQHALSAPFWSDGGGILYVHQLLPHPDGVQTALSLRDEYHMKMGQAVRFVSLIKYKLQRHFGKEYLLIVTSDHPLRTPMWCRKPAYESFNCTKENFPETNNVPFVVLAPKNLSVTIPTTNVGFLSPTT